MRCGDLVQVFVFLDQLVVLIAVVSAEAIGIVFEEFHEFVPIAE